MGEAQSVGTTVIQDATFTNAAVGVLTAYNVNQSGTSGILIIDNTEFINSPVAVRSSLTGNTIVEGNKLASSFVQGRSYVGSSGSAIQAEQSAFSKLAVLLDNAGHVFTRLKPEYRTSLLIK